MSKRHLRHDTTCQNCGQTVEKRFCGNCGQENTETRQSFAHLVRHFIEDLTHYDTSFWLTIKYLLFRPAYLTKEFLKGRRSSFLPPVRLYIFISFVTFLLPYVVPDYSEGNRSSIKLKHPAELKHPADTASAHPLVKVPGNYTSVRQLDSAQALLPEAERMSAVERSMVVKYISMQKYKEDELLDHVLESMTHSLPKALFIYMPLFALILWLFHNKKRWLFFDHAIFTLHYFSFILLSFNIFTFSSLLPNNGIVGSIAGVIIAIVLLYQFFYFFRAHRLMYEESRAVSILKSLVIYGVNLLLLTLFLIGLVLISILSIK